jgi:O-antigen/teichoic acid export membrane protein
MISLELNADPKAVAPATALLDRNDGAEPDAGKDTSARHARVGRIMTALTQLGLMQFAVAAGGVVRNKVMAVYLKPDGFGEFTQVFGIAAAVYGFVQFGMAVGLSRNVAATQERKDRQRQLDSANLLTVGLALGCLALLAPLLLTNASNTALTALGVRPGFEQKAMLLLLLLVAPIEALRNNYVSFLQGIVDVKGLSSKRSLAIVASTVVAVPLIALFGATGACIQAFVASLFLALLLGRRCRTMGYAPLGFVWDKTTIVALTSLGAASLVILFAHNFMDTIIRAHLILTAGLAVNGLYQAAFTLSSQIAAVVLGSIGTYAVATLSQTTDKNVIMAGLEDLLRVVLPVSTIGLAGVGLLSEPFFSVLFSSQFREGTKFLPLLLVANYIQVASWVAGAPILGCRLIFTWIAIQLTSVAIRYFLAVLWSPVIGVYAVPAGFLTAMTFDVVANMFVCKFRLGVSLERRTLLTFFAGGATITTAALVGCSAASLPAYVVGVGLLCCITAMMAWQEANAALRNLILRYQLLTQR